MPMTTLLATLAFPLAIGPTGPRTGGYEPQIVVPIASNNLQSLLANPGPAATGNPLTLPFEMGTADSIANGDTGIFKIEVDLVKTVNGVTSYSFADPSDYSIGPGLSATISLSPRQKVGFPPPPPPASPQSLFALANPPALDPSFTAARAGYIRFMKSGEAIEVRLYCYNDGNPPPANGTPGDYPGYAKYDFTVP